MPLPSDTSINSGTSGRLKFFVETFDTSADSDSQAWTGTTTVVDPAAMSWSKESSISQNPESLTFETEANEEGVLVPEQLRGGVGGTKFNIELELDNQSEAAADIIKMGAFCRIDFLVRKDVAHGYMDVKCKVLTDAARTGVNEKVATYSFSVQTSGPCPAFT